MNTRWRVVLLTGLAMLAFASNSLLCRFALGSHEMDPASFTLVRMVSGAVALAVLVWLRGGFVRSGRWRSSLFLFGYAIGFSFAYVSLPTGTGALLLFGAVQVTMIGVGISRGERLRWSQWTGLCMALAGLVWLVAPGVSAPSASGALLMMGAGVCWGWYSLAGRGSGSNPLAETAGNFVRSLVWAAPVFLVVLLWRGSVAANLPGLVAAVVSGAVTSGLGYAVWYTALKGLTPTRAAVVQLSVPVIAALAGILVLGEEVSLRLVVASVGVLGGIGLVVRG